MDKNEGIRRYMHQKWKRFTQPRCGSFFTAPLSQLTEHELQAIKTCDVK
jgi:hypothetical protein